MSSDRQQPGNMTGANQGTRGNRSRNTQPRSNITSTRMLPSDGSRTSERVPRSEKSVFTFVDGRNARTHADGPGLLSQGVREETAGREGRTSRNIERQQPTGRQQYTSRGRRRTIPGAEMDRVRGEYGEASRLSMITTYRRNLWANQTGNLRGSVSREIGWPDLINRPRSSSSSSETHQPNPNTFFTLVELESTKNVESTKEFQKPETSGLRMLSSESYYNVKTSKIPDFKETLKKLDDVPDWLPKAAESGEEPPIIPKIGTAGYSNSVKKTLNHLLAGGKRGDSTASTTFMPQKSLDPQELMKKLKEISENRRTYYVQKTGSDDDSLLDMLLQSPQRKSMESFLSLPMNAGRDFSPSTRALAGSMATLKFIELSKRKPGSVLQNASQADKKCDAHKVPRVKKCETFVPPIDVYRRDLIIDVPIDPLSPVEPHETVDAPSVETVIMINQICGELDNIFKDIHIGFYDSQEKIRTEEDSAKEQENKVFQRNESDKQLLLELKLSLLPASQALRRSIDSRRSIQSLGSRHSSRGSSLGDLQRSLSQPSLASLPQEPQMDTEELIQILNTKYEKSQDLDSPCSTISSHDSENDMKIIYSSSSAHLKRQLSKKTLETVADTNSEAASLQSDRKSPLHSSSSRRSSVKGGLRRFTAKVQIPTISDVSIAGESIEMKVSENEQEENEPVKIHAPSQMRAPSAASIISSSTIASAKLREAERQAIAELVEEEFGSMQLGTININPNDDLETRSQSQLYEVLATYAEPGAIGAESRDIFEGDQRLMGESGITKQLMLHKVKFPMETISEEHGSSSRPGHSSAKNKRSRSKKTTVSHETPTTEHEKGYVQEDMEELSHEECNEWVELIPSSNEEANERETEEEEVSGQNEVTDLVIDPQELRLLFPFAFRLSMNSSWWKRPRFIAGYREPITKEKAPEFDDLRDQLKALLEEYEENYSRFEAVYRWGDPKDPPVWNKKYRSPFLRPNVSDNQDPNRFHLSDDALSMKNNKECDDKHDKPPGYSTATFYVEPTKWWNLATVRRYVLRKELAKHTLERHRMRLGLRARPSKYSASLILGCRKRRSRKKGQVCRRKKYMNETWVAMFMKRNLPRSMWKDLKTKYELATSLGYRQRHHWNPFHPSNRPSINGTTRLGWYGQSLVRRNNITFLGQFARGVDEKPRAEVKAITESEIRDKWQRDIMEMAYVAYCTNKLITEELQFLVMIGFWLGVVIDEFSYFMKFMMGELGKEHVKKTMYEKKHPKKFRAHIHPGLLDGTEKKNPRIWEKILKVCDKTLFMLRRGLLPVEQDQAIQKDKEEEKPQRHEKYAESALSIPWYENTKLRRTNRRLLDSIALAYPDFYYLANKSNKYYHVELDADEARWFPIRYYDADTGEYNFISHDHPKWPDWKFLHMTSYGNAFQMNPITFIPYKDDAELEGQSGFLSEENLDDDNQIQEYRDSGTLKVLAPRRASKVSEKKKALVLMLMRECFDDQGHFRYILINPIKFDRKRINMSFKSIVKATTQMCTDPNTIGLDDIRARFLQKSKLNERYIKLDPETFQRLLKKYAAQGENPRSFTDRRIDIALDYWYRKAAQVNQLLEAISSKISAVDRIFTFLETHQEHRQLMVFDDPNSLKFQNEQVWNRRILENFQHGCSGRKDCDEEEHLISRSSQSSSSSKSTDETSEPDTPIDRIPSDFLKVMHTYFSLTTIETLKKENFVDFPVPLETLYCYERMKKRPRSKQRRVPYDRLSLRGRISERHRVRVERRRDMKKLSDKKKVEGGGDGGGGDGDHARCMGNEDDPRTHVGFKSKCPVCHKMLISHHPSLTLYIEFKSRHINEHRMNSEGIKPPKKAGYIKLKHPHTSDTGRTKAYRQNHNPGENAESHEDCYLHCRVPTILSIFQGRSVTKNKQEKLIRYFNRALHFEHAAVKDEITTRLNEEIDELDFLKHKQNYLQELHDTICERTTCPTISQQIHALLTHEELLNDLYICWLDAYSRGTNILHQLAPHVRSNRVYLPDNITTNFLDTMIKVLRRPELPKMKEKSKISVKFAATEGPGRSPFELWFEDFVTTGLLPKRSSALDVPDEELHDRMSLISSRFNLLDHSDQSFAKRGDGLHEDGVSLFSHQEDQGRHQELSSEDESSESHNSQGRLIDVSPSDFEAESDND